MKLISMSTSVAALLLLAGAANANDDFLASCEAYAEANGAEVNCTCLDEAGEADPSLFDEFAKIAAPEDVANVSEAAQAVIAQCAAE